MAGKVSLEIAVDGLLVILSVLLQYALLLALLWLVLTLLAAFAYRVNLGSQPLPMEVRECLWRSALAGLGLAVYTTLAYALASFVVVVVGGGEPATAQRLALYLHIPYPVVAVFLFNWAFALDDLLEGFKIYLIQQLLALLLLVLLGLVVSPVGDFLHRLVS
jgi:hypothetical protein